MAESKTGSRGQAYTLELVGLEPGGARPPLLVQAVDAKGGILHSEKVGDTGGFSLPADALKNAQYVVFGAPTGEKAVDAAAAVRFRPHEFEAAARGGTLAIAEGIWSRLRTFWTCVSGSVRVCRRRRPWFDDIITAVSQVSLPAPAFQRRQASFGAAAASPAGLRPSLNDILAWPTRCYPVCLGDVTVYRRTCCCSPLVIDDLRIPDLLRHLERIVATLPKLTQPKFPVPPPPPDPFSTAIFKGGALNELALNAPADLGALRTLGGEAAVQYVNSRAYLLRHICSCSRPLRVASGPILADGTFNICWIERLRLLQHNCHDEYAYVVTQTIGGTTTTIYDGLAAGAWYHAGDHPVLTTYRADAYHCDETGTGDGTASVLLDLIGDTDSHELTTPDATGWDRVMAPDPTSGLLFPDPLDSRGHLRNLGGRLELTLKFTDGMRDPAVDATHYRISVAKADANGNPIGPRMYYGQGINNGNDTLTWQKIVGGDIVPEVLGPNPVNGVNYLYRIPYEGRPGDPDWVGTVRYHALLDTRSPSLQDPPDVEGQFDPDAANHLVTIEVFDSTGKRIRPLGTPASGQPGVEGTAPFKFKRWFQPEGSPGDDLKDVNFAALTHLFCWDNRSPQAEITRLVTNSQGSDEMCQFIQGPGASTFGIEYRAFVADERFQHGHSIQWTRGLGGTDANGGKGSLPTPLSPSNVGEPLDAPQNSGTNTFQTMLTLVDPGPPEVVSVLERCAFSVTLTTHAKTTDGGNLGYPEAQATAAFALQLTPAP